MVVRPCMGLTHGRMTIYGYNTWPDDHIWVYHMVTAASRPWCQGAWPKTRRLSPQKSSVAAWERACAHWPRPIIQGRVTTYGYNTWSYGHIWVYHMVIWSYMGITHGLMTIYGYNTYLDAVLDRSGGASLHMPSPHPRRQKGM